MKETTLRFYKERMLRVLVHIQQRLDEPLALHTLAALACLSPHHFHRVFTGMIGESVMGHVRRLRLERAATRLKLSDAPVVQIALEAGYDTHEAFTRAFGKSFGRSPRATPSSWGNGCRAAHASFAPPRVSSSTSTRRKTPTRPT